MLESFSTSFGGKIIVVEYTLKVFILHDAWNEWGEGRCAARDITIMRQPVKIE